MILAAYNDTAYDIVLFLHVVAVLVAMAPAVAHPLLFMLEKRRSDADLVALSGRIAAASRIYLIALIVAGVIGFGLISMSDDAIAWGDTWVWLSIILWVVLNGVLHAVMFPAEQALASGDLSALKKIDAMAPVLGLLTLALFFLMVVKPGSGGL